MTTVADRRAVEVAKSSADPAYFTHNFLIIDDAQGDAEGGGTAPFHLWPAQVQVLWWFLKYRLVLILKARQLGISWLCCSYALWLCVFQPGRKVLCFSKGDLEAMELIRRIKALYDRLPEWMREALPALVKKNTKILEWDNGSSVQSFPATKDAGSGYTASLVIMDEFAKVLWARDLYMAVKPTIDGGGQLIILSTAKGIGNQFHLLWTRAVAGVNAFKTIFLPWWSRPGRTLSWYRAQQAEYSDPEMVHQEYPQTAQEAFVASGRVRFKADWIERQAERVATRLPEEQTPQKLREVPDLKLYKLPVIGRRYVLAADVAEGLEKGDYSVGVVIDHETREECASFHGHWEPDIFGEYLAILGTFYNEALVAPERNNHGHTVLAALKRLHYPRVYEATDGKKGWLTSIVTKPQMIDYLGKCLREGCCPVNTPAALDEMQIYQILKNGTTGAPEGYFDDYVMAWAIGLMVAQTSSAGDWADNALSPEDAQRYQAESVRGSRLW